MQTFGKLISRSRCHLHLSIRSVSSLSPASDSNYAIAPITTHRCLLGEPACKPQSPFRTPFRRNLILQTALEPVKLHRLSDSDSGIIEVRLDRAEAKNAIGKEMLKGIQRAIEVINGDSSANVVMVSSSVPRVFCAGADLKERRLMGPSEVQSFVNSLRSTFSSFQAIEVPTIAIVEGAALGGGLELALSCDIRVCGESATFSLPETGLAIIPGAGGTQRLPRIVGRSIAKELIFTGRRIDATKALSIGLVNYCVPVGEAYQKALEIAREINQKGPLALKMAKKAIDAGMEVDLSSALSIEENCYEELLNTEDRLEGLAAFAEKRKPKYTDFYGLHESRRAGINHGTHIIDRRFGSKVCLISGQVAQISQRYKEKELDLWLVSNIFSGPLDNVLEEVGLSICPSNL